MMKRPGQAGKMMVTLYPSDSYAETVHLVGDLTAGTSTACRSIATGRMLPIGR